MNPSTIRVREQSESIHMQTTWTSLVFNRSVVSTFASFICCFILISNVNIVRHNISILTTIQTTTTTTSEGGTSNDRLSANPLVSVGTTTQTRLEDVNSDMGKSVMVGVNPLPKSFSPLQGIEERPGKNLSGDSPPTSSMPVQDTEERPGENLSGDSPPKSFSPVHETEERARKNQSGDSPPMSSRPVHDTEERAGKNLSRDSLPKSSSPLYNVEQRLGKNFLVNPHESSYKPLQDVKGRLEENHIEKKKCDIYDGRWVYDPKGSPMYDPYRCPYLSPQVTCKKNGRPDHDYEKWRWEGNNCEIPRFNGTDFMERLRGKKVIVAGDSLNRNQWESVSCLLYSLVPRERTYVSVHRGDYKVFRALDYECRVEFYWSPFLIKLDETNPEAGRILKLDELPHWQKKWLDADLMIFDTGHWWAHTGKSQMWDLAEYQGKLTNMTTEEALEAAMETWGRWLDQNVDPAKTTVFFRSISPEHKGYINWDHWCYNHTQPIKDGETFYSQFPEPIIEIIERSIRKIKTPVKYLNITKLSEARRDAHPQVYTAKQGILLTEEQRKQPKEFADCSHWCLPGVPDTWNQLLYNYILHGDSTYVL